MTKSGRFFQIGSWGLVVTGLFHLVGHLSGSPDASNDGKRKLFALADDLGFKFTGARRSLLDLYEGFSLSVAILLVFAGLTALAIARSDHDALVRRTAIQNSAMSGLLAAVSLAHFYALPTVFLFVVFLAYFAALVTSTRPASA